MLTTTEPLKSALGGGGADDTSLAVPTDDTLRSGQRRVLDQVLTLKRSKSKQHGKNGTVSARTLSPTSPVSEFGSFKLSFAKANGTMSTVGSRASAGYSKSMKVQKSQTMSSKSSIGRHFSSAGAWEKQMSSSNWPSSPSELKPSRSDPSLAPSFSAVPNTAAVVKTNGQSYQSSFQSQKSMRTQVKRQSTYSVSNTNQMSVSKTGFVCPPSVQSQTDGKMGTIKISSKPEQSSVVNSTTSMLDLTLKEAVEYLSHSDENYQRCGATFIQHATFKEEHTKQEVLQLGGIPTLVSLLRSSNPAVGQAAAGALRNLVFKHPPNKQQVQQCGGIGKALQLLKETDSTETQKQITGLLWNLSSADELKAELIATALPALTENVLVPFTCWSDSTATNNIHPDVFYNATGCLRNLSCGKQKERQAMRECPGLIDSLMSYVQSCVAEETPDEKSVENCVCILHNLTYQLEAENPVCFEKYQPRTEAQLENKKSPPVGCFSPKSSKAQKQFSFDETRLIIDKTPTGLSWLFHPTAMQTYLSLLGMSQKDGTLEAACGALQNLTAGKGLGSSAMSQIMVQKLGALPHLSPLLTSPNPSLQKTAVSLLGNIARSSSSSVQSSMAKEVLPELSGLLSSSPKELGINDEAVSTACSTAQTLMVANPEASKRLITNELVSALADLTENGSFPKGSKAASLLLYTVWNEKSLQAALKKLGLEKSLFVNDKTTSVYKAAQVVE